MIGIVSITAERQAKQARWGQSRPAARKIVLQGFNAGKLFINKLSSPVGTEGASFLHPAASSIIAVPIIAIKVVFIPFPLLV
ncbi:hypothetical protein [Treponema endosymbiont of Eucomonympha sp.]|uniref:hypothetical protein n=1 Tax=Treponema endosymbiont of Eucomonympha sp. TaxID=1580831 RepID=UPI00164FF070|nr:hypothetical protein [Treponema endosymbiont of Eucomonympha sp.]